MLSEEVLKPSQEELDVIISELGGNGYYGWIKTKKIKVPKVLLKGELWHVKNGTPELKYRLIFSYTPDQNQPFQEMDICAAFYEEGDSLLGSFLEKIKDLNLNSLGPLASQFLNQSNP